MKISGIYKLDSLIIIGFKYLDYDMVVNIII